MSDKDPNWHGDNWRANKYNVRWFIEAEHKRTRSLLRGQHNEIKLTLAGISEQIDELQQYTDTNQRFWRTIVFLMLGLVIFGIILLFILVIVII